VSRSINKYDIVLVILRWSLCALFVAVLPAEAPAKAPAEATTTVEFSQRTPESYVANRPFLRTSAEILTFNVGMTVWGHYLIKRDDSGYDVSVNSLTTNPKFGFQWDNNTFFVNYFRHPYQGAQYYGAGRANGYDYYQSGMWSFAGSWLFEYMGESKRPSYNDWITSGVGGMVLGEPLFRLSSVVLDNQATGSSRVLRELGGLVILPVRGVNRLVTGEAFQVHTNPTDRRPIALDSGLRIGAWTPDEEHQWDSRQTKAFFGFDLSYGNPFEERVKKPFDVFTSSIDVAFDNEPQALRRLEIYGMIAGTSISHRQHIQHVIAGVQSYDYFQNDVFAMGTQSFGASLLSRFRMGGGFDTQTVVTASWILLGAANSHYVHVSDRRYDIGPGAAYNIGLQFLRNERRVIELGHAGYWIHALNGTAVDHFIGITRVRANLMLMRFVGIGFEYLFYTAEKKFEDFPDVYAQGPELRAFMIYR
jgi:hypothetical protein